MAYTVNNLYQIGKGFEVEQAWKDQDRFYNKLSTNILLIYQDHYQGKRAMEGDHSFYNERNRMEMDDQFDDEQVKVAPPGRQLQREQQKADWKNLALRTELKRAIKQQKFLYPSEVQRLGIVEILQGNNLICQAKSGTGKTAVFVLSILQMIEPEQEDMYLPHQCLIIVPTRQLVHQILKEFIQFSKYITPKIPISGFFGGVSIQSNVAELANPSTSPAIIISTPGRLNDLYQRKYIIIQNCKYFILDECDKIIQNPKMMADFCTLYQHAPQTKQSLMFSATMTPAALLKMKTMMNPTPVVIKIEEDYTILNRLTQFFQRITEMDKLKKLLFILDTVPFSQCIIFVNRIDNAKRLVWLLKQDLYNPLCMNSSLKQEERILNYDLFKEKGSKLLVATDVFGRGIDMRQVNLVINYDFPRDSETYLHRVGRAGRFGQKGIAINFVRIDDGQGRGSYENDEDQVGILREHYKVKIKKLPDQISIVEFL